MSRESNAVCDNHFANPVLRDLLKSLCHIHIKYKVLYTFLFHVLVVEKLAGKSPDHLLRRRLSQFVSSAEVRMYVLLQQ